MLDVDKRTRIKAELTFIETCEQEEEEGDETLVVLGSGGSRDACCDLAGVGGTTTVRAPLRSKVTTPVSCF